MSAPGTPDAASTQDAGAFIGRPGPCGALWRDLRDARSRLRGSGEEPLCDVLAVALGPTARARSRAFPELARNSAGACRFARSLGLSFGRGSQGNARPCFQDITGSSLLEAGRCACSGRSLRNVLLVDEINRATPRNAVLAARGDAGAQSPSKARPGCPNPFFVVARFTEPTVEAGRTFSLPEAQLDRFLVLTTWATPSAKTSAGSPAGSADGGRAFGALEFRSRAG